MEVSSADKFDAAFKEATKAGSGALVVTRSTLSNSYQERIADLAMKISVAGDNQSSGFCRERRFDVLRCRPSRALQARRIDGR